MLRALWIKQHARTDGSCQQRDGNPNKEPTRNVRDKKKNTVTEMKNTNLGLISKLDTSKGKNL